MSSSQVEELISSGFTREEAMWALNQSNDPVVEETNTEMLAKYMKQIESQMLKLNEFSAQYNKTIESKLKSIHEEAASYRQLINQKEKELTNQIEQNRNTLKSTLHQMKQIFIHLIQKLHKMKQSLDVTDMENKQNNTSQHAVSDLSDIKQQIDDITSDKYDFLNVFDTKKISLNNHWYAIKQNIMCSDFIQNTENETKTNDDDDDNDNILSISLMTFNIRNSLLDKQYDRLWNEKRRKLTANMLKHCGPPTLIATQEGVINQLLDIQHDLPSNFMSVGEGRLKQKWYNNNSDRMNEHVKIFWDNDVLKVIDYGTFQLKRPKHAPLPRIATWCLYEFNTSKYNSKYALFVVNTHLRYSALPNAHI